MRYIWECARDSTAVKRLNMQTKIYYADKPQHYIVFQTECRKYTELNV